MKNHPSIEQKLEKIQNVFQQALYISTEKGDLVIQEHLKNIDQEFRAVAFEGVAMGLAVKDLSEGHLQQWRSFMRASDQSYVPHIHIGLGWAIAKRKLPSLFFLDTVNPLMLYRVLDGCGCYDGIFKQIQTIQNKVVPDYIEEKNIDAYDQGIGRSLWSVCKGDHEKISNLIQGFSPSRQADLWRGVGIACSFVGGCSESTLNALFFSASDHSLQLALGAAIVAKSRILTNSVTKDSEMTCSIWCNLSVLQARTIAEEPPYAIIPEDAYKQWLRKMEAQLLHKQIDPIRIID
ncbi:MAG: DUF1702 family protein [Chryseolinea sp.]